MKKTLLSVLCLIAIILSVQAQPILYTTTSSAGSANYGTIVKYDVATNEVTLLKSFTGPDGEIPNGLLEASNGKLYGTTYGGGIYNYGVLYSFDPVANTYTKLFDFNGSNGAQPRAPLIQGTDGKLYGITGAGGKDFQGENNIGDGVIFSFDPSTNTYTKLVDLVDYYPVRFSYAPLLQASDGKLYGTTKYGGSTDYGVLFSFDPVTKTFKVVSDLGAHGIVFPLAGVTQASNGKLYGTGPDGNDFFTYDLTTNTTTKIFSLTSPDGRYPSTKDGHFPSTKMLQATNGKLYGTMNDGGSFNKGVIYSVNTSTNTYTKLFDLDGTNGSNPDGDLMQASNGKIYGTAATGGSAGKGVIYSFDPATNAYTKLIDFNGGNGAIPVAGFIEYKPVSTCTPFTVTIPEVQVLPSGVQPNTVYHGYAPADSVTLTAQVSGGAANDTYTYLWCDGETTKCIRVSPQADKHYTVIVTSTVGCSYSGGLQLKAVNVRCGDNLDKVKVCRRMPGNAAQSLTTCMDAGDVAAQLNNGATLGSCSGDVTNPAGLVISTSPNPSYSSFTLFITGNASGEQANLRVVNAFGRVVESREVGVNQTLQLGVSYQPGIYYIEVAQGNSKTSTKVIKQGR